MSRHASLTSWKRTHTLVYLSRDTYFQVEKNTHVHVYLSLHAYFTNWKKMSTSMTISVGILVKIIHTDISIWEHFPCRNILTGIPICSCMLTLQVEKNYPKAYLFEPTKWFYMLKIFYKLMSMWVCSLV